MSDKNPIQVADKLFLVLETLAQSGPVTLADLTRRLELNKSTAHRLLSSLIYMGYVKQEDGTQKYELSLKLLSISNQFLTRMDIVDVMRPHLKALAEETGETVHFVQLDGIEAVYIYKEESYQNSVRMSSKVGNRIPLYCSGVGKAILAHMNEDAVSQIWGNSDIQTLTSYTITEYTRFLKQLENIRQCGYSLDNEENELGVRCIAVSIPDYSGNYHYALSISAPTTRMSDERIETLSKLILNEKAAILKSLGCN